MTATATANGRPQRKQLSDQLDRLDAILDVLADGLPEAVGDAVLAGTRTALKDLLTEVLADPDTVALLRRVIAPPPPTTPEPEPMPVPDVAPPSVPVKPPRPSFWAQCRAALRGRVAKVRGAVAAAVVPLTDGLHALRLLTPGVELGRATRRAAIVAVLLGGAATALALASHPVAAALSGVGVAATALAVQAAVGAHRLVCRFLGGNG